MSSLATARFLPAHIPVDQVICTVGVIADTHMPERCVAFPPTLFPVFSGVDLVLHAGDVGALWVLDHLSTLAPVVAVHGNDDSVEARHELPFQQIVAIAGQRVVVSHGHQRDPAEEAAARREDRWAPKLARFAALGQRVGATIVVSGHTHIPLALQHHGVWLVNPGALASPNAVTRQRVQTVALLFFCATGSPLIVHVDLADPTRAFVPAVDWSAGFRSTLEHVSASILSPALAAEWDQVSPCIRSLTQEQKQALLLPIARPCWTGQQEVMTPADLLTALHAVPDIPDVTREALVRILGGGRA